MVRKLKYACDFGGIRAERKNKKADGALSGKILAKLRGGGGQR